MGGQDEDLSRASEEELVARFHRRIVVMAIRRTGDSATAEEVAQEALRRVVEALRERRLEKPEALAGFVFQTARNVLLHRQRSGVRGRRALGRLAREPDPRDTHRHSSLLSLIDRERCREVRRALHRLEHDDRELLVLSFYDELDPSAIAARFDVKVGTLRVRKHRALQRLRHLLEAGHSERESAE